MIEENCGRPSLCGAGLCYGVALLREVSENGAFGVFDSEMRGIFLAGVGAGVVEELLFRGLLMNAVIQKYGRAAGIFGPSVLFALLHIIGMNFSLLSCVQVMVAGTFVGVMFSLIALEGRSVWNSAIVHAVWNMIIIGGGLVIGTKIDEYAVCSYVLETRSFLLTGGEFGIESSVVSIIGYLAVSLAAVWMMKRDRREEIN